MPPQSPISCTRAGLQGIIFANEHHHVKKQTYHFNQHRKEYLRVSRQRRGTRLNRAKRMKVCGGCPYVFVKCQTDVGEYSLGGSFLGVPRSRPACAGRLRLWGLCGDGAWRDFAEELLVFQHRVDDIASPSCQAYDCCVVAFSFSAFALVIPP